MGLRQAQLPGTSCVLDGGEGTGAGAAVAAGDLDDVGVRLGHAAGDGADSDAGHELDGYAGLLVHSVQIMN